MEKLSTTIPVKTTDHQSLKTGYRTSPSTDLDIEKLKKKQDEIRKRHGFKPKSKQQERKFVPEISVCEKHGKFESTYLGPSFRDRPGKIHTRERPGCVEERCLKEEQASKLEAIKRKLSVCGVPKRYRDKSVHDVDTKDPVVLSSLKALSGYMSNFENVVKTGASGFMCGNCGTGKTMFACMVVENAIRSGFYAKYITAWRMIQEIRIGYSASDTSIVNQIQLFISPDILVIDEIGVQHGTEDERVLLYQVIDGRYNEVKPTILISNSKNPVDDGYIDTRTIDRLKEGGGFSMTFNGESYRR